MRTKVVAVMASMIVLAGGLFAVGTIVTAQDAEGEGNPLIERVAELLGIAPDDLTGAFRTAGIERIDERVASGELSEEKAAEIRERIESSDGLPFRGGRRHKGNFEEKAQHVADFLGLSLEEVQQAHEDGQKLSEILEANGKTKEEFRTYLEENGVEFEGRGERGEVEDDDAEAEGTAF
ncbi:MAG TPA: hypothetical protein ENI23_10305 [bacterium]|nr:hypothetical protein [bacterium]